MILGAAIKSRARARIGLILPHLHFKAIFLVRGSAYLISLRLQVLQLKKSLQSAQALRLKILERAVIYLRDYYTHYKAWNKERALEKSKEEVQLRKELLYEEYRKKAGRKWKREFRKGRRRPPWTIDTPVFERVMSDFFK